MQKEVFLNSAGNAWHERNINALLKIIDRQDGDMLGRMLIDAFSDHMPKRILEIGAGNGWRLAFLKSRFPEAECFGVEPSPVAIEDGRLRFPQVTLARGTADSLPYPDGSFDLIVFGFCLSLCDPKDLFHIAAEADRVLTNHGHIASLDFSSPIAYRNRYAHTKEEVYSYKMEYTKMFTWNPAYRHVKHQIMDVSWGRFEGNDDGAVSLDLLRKDENTAYVDNPYRSTTHQSQVAPK